MSIRDFLIESQKNNKKVFIYGYNQLADSIILYSKSLTDGVEIAGIIVSKGYERIVHGKRTLLLEEILEPEKVAIIIAVKYVHFNEVIPELVRKGCANLYFINGKEEFKLLNEFNDFYTRENLNVDEIYKQQDHFYQVAKRIAEFLSTIISPKTVIDFGCGAGTWLRAFKDTFSDISVLGLDTSDIDRSRCLSEEEFNRVNFEELILDNNTKYDLAISIEVAEHLDELYADVFIDNICKSSDIVLFSAAIKYQGGDHHVNEQFPSYWVKKFKERDFRCIDCIRPNFWDDAFIDVIYKENMFLFVKENQYDEISSRVNYVDKFLDWVHPDLYSIKMSLAYDGTLR